MKNIHILPTDKPSRLNLGDNGNFVFGIIQTSIQSRNDDFTNQNIHITSDEKIKEGDYYIHGNRLHKHLGKKCLDVLINKEFPISRMINDKVFKKIILTTDQDLIADGIQAIDDGFLEWFVKNPSCEEVETSLEETQYGNGIYEYVIYKKFIPKEEPKQSFYCSDRLELDDSEKCIIQCDVCSVKPKQETLEEAAREYFKRGQLGFEKAADTERAFFRGGRWKQERSYSEEDMINASKYGYNFHKTTQFPNQEFEDSAINNTKQWLTTLKEIK